MIAIAIEQIAISLTRTKALGWTQSISWVVKNHIGTAGQHASQLLAQVGIKAIEPLAIHSLAIARQQRARNHWGRQVSIGTPLPNSGVGKKRTKRVLGCSSARRPTCSIQVASAASRLTGWLVWGEKC